MHKRTFLVRGTDRPSGKEKEMKIDAVSHAKAAEVAEASGIEVYCVEYGDSRVTYREFTGAEPYKPKSVKPPAPSITGREVEDGSTRSSSVEAQQSRLLRYPEMTIAVGIVLGLFLWTVLVILVYIFIISVTGFVLYDLLTAL